MKKKGKKMFKWLFFVVLIFISCTDKPREMYKPQTTQDTPKCPPFVYRYDTGKKCAHRFTHRINKEVTIEFIEYSNDSYAIGASYAL
jgi:hypothetical protein